MVQDGVWKECAQGLLYIVGVAVYGEWEGGYVCDVSGDLERSVRVLGFRGICSFRFLSVVTAPSVY